MEGDQVGNGKEFDYKDNKDKDSEGTAEGPTNPNKHGKLLKAVLDEIQEFSNMVRAKAQELTQKYKKVVMQIMLKAGLSVHSTRSCNC